MDIRVDLKYTAEEEAFRAEVRAFFDAELPADIRAKTRLGRRLRKDDLVRWQKILYRHGWGAGDVADADSAAPAGTSCSSTSSRRSAPTLGAPPQNPFSLKMLAPVLMTFGNAGAAGLLPAAHPRRRGLVVPGLFRTGLRLRPRLAAHQRRASRRSLHRQRPEDLEHAGSVRRLDLLPGAHQHRRRARSRASRSC